jgi:hypothetical protein
MVAALAIRAARAWVEADVVRILHTWQTC